MLILLYRECFFFFFTGLCGYYNGNNSDDLIDASGNSHTVPTNKRPDTFSLSWRYGEIYQD